MEYARFTEESNSLDYLEKAVSFIKSAENKPEDWKWTILAAHGALYGFMICTLRGTTPDNVSTGKKQKLIGFNDALKRCQGQDPEWMLPGGYTKVALSENQQQALRQLSNFRNKFVHFDPALWSIPEDAMRETLTHALGALRAVLGMGCRYVNLAPGDSEKLATLLQDATHSS